MGMLTENAILKVLQTQTKLIEQLLAEQKQTNQILKGR
jgi:hypothetical protein